MWKSFKQSKPKSDYGKWSLVGTYFSSFSYTSNMGTHACGRPVMWIFLILHMISMKWIFHMKHVIEKNKIKNLVAQRWRSSFRIYIYIYIWQWKVWKPTTIVIFLFHFPYKDNAKSEEMGLENHSIAFVVRVTQYSL